MYFEFLTTFEGLVFNMEPVYEKIYNQKDASFNVLDLKADSFNFPYHFHPEYELTLITKGTGHRFVGDHTDIFVEHDLVLLGSNLPHCWLDYGENKSPVSAVVVQFEENSFGSGFFNLPEMFLVKALLEKSVKGIQFKNVPKSIVDKFSRLPLLNGMNQLLSFMTVMDYLSKHDNILVLSGSEYGLKHFANSKFTRINDVFKHVSDNFKKDISVTDVADLVHMSPSAFCHYFKKYTKKTFTQYLNEVRVGYACKILMETDVNVSQVCYLSGYNSLSMFNKSFKKITSKTPMNYRKQFHL